MSELGPLQYPGYPTPTSTPTQTPTPSSYPSNYCINNTSYSSYDDNFISNGDHNGYPSWVGANNGYYLFFKTSTTQWCLSDTLDGDCLLSGKSPCTSRYPDIFGSYLSSGTCPTPTPTPTNNCSVLDFNSFFDCSPVDFITPTPTPTNSSTPTPTPTSTNACGILRVNAVINSLTPTPTQTPTITPTSSSTIIRNLNFSGDVTFNTVDTNINCPISKQFSACDDSNTTYTTTNVLVNPSGGLITKDMVFNAIVDGQPKCISYIGVTYDIIGNNVISLTTGPLGFSYDGGCELCLTPPTPTPTMTMTPTPTKPLAWYCARPCPSTLEQSNPLLSEELPPLGFSCWASPAYRKIALPSGLPMGTTITATDGFCYYLTERENPEYTMGPILTQQGTSTYIDCNSCLPVTPTPTPTPTPTMTPTQTQTPTMTPTNTQTPTYTPSTTPTPTATSCGCIGGNVIIGTQTWTSCNLDVTKYRDDTDIPQVTNDMDWDNLTTGAWCYYNNDSTSGCTYGKLYNWFAVAGIYDEASLNDPLLRKQLAPVGYHIPTETEWTTLTNELGGDGVTGGAGGKLKETGTLHWIQTQGETTNSSNFTALGAGVRNYGSFVNIKMFGNFWTSTPSTISLYTAKGFQLTYQNSSVNTLNFSKADGLSIRLVKD